MMDTTGGQWLDKVRGEIDRAERGLERERERLLADRQSIDRQIAALEHEMRVLQRLNSESDLPGGDAAPSLKPLSRRVLEILHGPPHELTSREMREQLQLNRRESRNLGPVLNQLMKAGKVANAGRGAPWRLVA